MRSYWLKIGAKYLFFILAMGALFGYIVMSLWNWLMPEIFGLTEITFIQAIGMLILSKILFGGIFKGSHHKKKSYWKSRMKRKMESMDPDQREKFMTAFKRKCWGYEEPSSTDSQET